MLESINWIRDYFDQSPDAVMIFQNDGLVLSNRLAQHLTNQIGLSPDYILQIAKNAWQQHGHNDCANCQIKSRMDFVAVPISSRNPQGQKIHFSLVYKPLESKKGVFALILENREQQQRLTKIEEQRQLNQYVNRAHERERQRISQDLHDSIAQGVYSAIMGVRRLHHEDLSTLQRAQISQAVEIQLQETLAAIKGMALDIRPSVLDSFGLIPAVKALAKRLQENSGVTINVIGNASTDQLTTDVENVLYRICQEAINNAPRHASPNEINVIITDHPRFIQLEVLDDGRGFDPQQHGFNGHSLGLMNMNERVEALNGAFSIHSKPNAGTTITVKFPYQQTN